MKMMGIYGGVYFYFESEHLLERVGSKIDKDVRYNIYNCKFCGESYYSKMWKNTFLNHLFIKHRDKIKVFLRFNNKLTFDILPVEIYNEYLEQLGIKNHEIKDIPLPD
jgi:hypothetical protein